MNRAEYLLAKLMEEAGEVTVAAAKCAVFGFDDVNILKRDDPNHPNNAEILAREIDDLIGVREMLEREGLIRSFNAERVAAKIEKVEKWMEYSREKGTLNEKRLQRARALCIKSRVGREKPKQFADRFIAGLLREGCAELPNFHHVAGRRDFQIQNAQ